MHYDPKKDLKSIRRIRLLFRLAEKVVGPLDFNEQGLAKIARSPHPRAQRISRLIRRELEKLLERHHPLLVWIVESFEVPDQNTFQEYYSEAVDGFLHALFKFDEGKGVKFATYATIWARSRIGSLAERNKEFGRFFDEGLPPRSARVYPDNALHLDVRSAFESLKERDKMIVWKYAVLGYTYEEIAKEYGVSKQRIEQVYKRCLRRMREKLSS
ncbi:MAG: hypothetical protein DRN14_05060 [Thermoplasmata archaeon]|nr:MAG: hypothetical protein DRN14_05060 [Thermoplasmata archaeon]